jgi:hypothetical protein
MDENQFRATYHRLNPNRCIFEKAITNRRCNCEKKRKFTLATREGVACNSKESLTQCTKFLNQLRNSSRFALKVVFVDGPFPHNKELRVQAGGTLALQKILYPDGSQPEVTTNIHQLIQQALLEYGSLENIPYGEMIKGVLTYKVRNRKR